MTVEAYLRSLVVGLDLDKDVLTRAAYSPIEVGLAPFELSDDAYPKSGIDDNFQKRLDPVLWHVCTCFLYSTETLPFLIFLFYIKYNILSLMGA